MNPNVEPAFPIVAVVNYTMHHRPASLRNYARIKRTPSIIVLHATAGHEGTTKDTDVAAQFQDPKLDPRRSSGYIVDADSVAQCVADHYVAWHCGQTGNMRGIGVELCGRADQTRSQWLDPLSHRTLCIGARLVADLCLEWHIPPVYVDARELVAGARGITTHDAVRRAWHQTKHIDPGEGFPLSEFVQAVAAAVALGAPRHDVD